MKKNVDEIIKEYIKKVFMLFHKKLSEDMAESFLQFIKFGLIGVSNTVISYVLNILVLIALQPMGVAWDYIAGNVVAFMISVLWSFYWNNRFVFTVQEGEHRSLARALIKTYISYGFTGIVLNNILSWLWITVFSISKFVAPLINLIVSVPINFVVNKLWAFKAESK